MSFLCCVDSNWCSKILQLTSDTTDGLNNFLHWACHLANACLLKESIHETDSCMNRHGSIGGPIY